MAQSKNEAHNDTTSHNKIKHEMTLEGNETAPNESTCI